MARKYFGTDGMRGRVGVEPMTAGTVMKLGWAAGKVLASQGCLLYTSPSPRDGLLSRMPSSA